MSNDNDKKQPSDFSGEMANIGVSPLKQRDQKVILHPQKRPDINRLVRRAAAESDLPQENDPNHYGDVQWLGPHDLVEHKREGIQHDVLKDLKQGRYEIGADLDLHSYRVDAAKIALFQFVNDCMEHDIRCAIVIHGKGWHGAKTESASRLKSYVVHWLKAMNVVMAFSSAQPRDGGTGALYVLFKKSDRAKEANRHHFRSDDN